MPIDGAALDHFLSWEGAVGRGLLRRRIEPYEEIVRANAPIRIDSPNPHHLAGSISHDLGNEGTALVAHIGANPREHRRGYALIVHNGSRPHQIRPHRPPQSLRFRVAGRIVFTQRVNHPGTRPDPFLTRWLRELTR